MTEKKPGASNMDLADFIHATLTQIVAGVSSAKKEIAKIDPSARINPSVSHVKWGETNDVEFDVAVTVVDGAKVDGGAKLKIAALVSVGASGSSESTESITSRIKFKIPMAVPHTPDKRSNDSDGPLVGSNQPFTV